MGRPPDRRELALCDSCKFDNTTNQPVSGCQCSTGGTLDDGTTACGCAQVILDESAICGDCNHSDGNGFSPTVEPS